MEANEFFCSSGARSSPGEVFLARALPIARWVPHQFKLGLGTASISQVITSCRTHDTAAAFQEDGIVVLRIRLEDNGRYGRMMKEI
jgi:hypothetical protein